MFSIILPPYSITQPSYKPHITIEIEALIQRETTLARTVRLATRRVWRSLRPVHGSVSWVASLQGEGVSLGDAGNILRKRRS
jgi:hypothetical protein